MFRASHEEQRVDGLPSVGFSVLAVAGALAFVHLIYRAMVGQPVDLAGQDLAALLGPSFAIPYAWIGRWAITTEGFHTDGRVWRQPEAPVAWESIRYLSIERDRLFSSLSIHLDKEPWILRSLPTHAYGYGRSARIVMTARDVGAIPKTMPLVLRRYEERRLRRALTAEDYEKLGAISEVDYRRAERQSAREAHEREAETRSARSTVPLALGVLGGLGLGRWVRRGR